MSERLIDADALIEAAEVNGEDRGFVRKLIDYVEDAEEAIPPAGTVQEWIPVSERMPEPSFELLLVSGYIKIGSLKTFATDMAIWNGDDWTFEGEPIPEIVVLAWMPLPEPYREVEE